jgi:hypothetical protein
VKQIEMQIEQQKQQQYRAKQEAKEATLKREAENKRLNNLSKHMAAKKIDKAMSGLAKFMQVF